MDRTSFDFDSDFASISLNARIAATLGSFGFQVYTCTRCVMHHYGLSLVSASELHPSNQATTQAYSF